MISVSTVDALPPMSSDTIESTLLACTCVRVCVTLCVLSVCVCVRVCAARAIPDTTTPMEVAATPSQCLSKLLFFTLTQFNEFVKITFGTLCLLIDVVVVVVVALHRQPLQTTRAAHFKRVASIGIKFNLPALC